MSKILPTQYNKLFFKHFFYNYLQNSQNVFYKQKILGNPQPQINNKYTVLNLCTKIVLMFFLKYLLGQITKITLEIVQVSV